MVIRSLALILVLVVLSSCEDITYNTRYDDVDLDEILANDRLLMGYIKCLMEEGPCTADAKELKNTLPDAIANACIRCSEKQREGSAKVMHFIIDHRPDDWTRLEKIYDPQGSYRKAYLDSKKSSKEWDTEKAETPEPEQELQHESEKER